MTCNKCKFYLPYPHKYEGRDYEGICRYEPETFHKSGNMWCGKFKNKQAKPRKVKSFEACWSGKFKEFMEVFPCYREPDKAWRVWDDLCLEMHADHIIQQAAKYKALVVSEARESKYIKSNKNWLQEGGWKTHYDELTADPKDCVDCGKPFELGHKYSTVKGEKLYKCQECRTK